MARRILLSCYEAPSWGGASTVAYALFEQMQRDGLGVAYVNLVHRNEEDFFRRTLGPSFGNPRALPDVHTCVLDEPLWRLHDPLRRIISQARPDLLFGFGFIAARLLQLAAPELPSVFMTSGTRRVKHLLEEGAVGDFMGFRRSVEAGIRFPVSSSDPERETVENCELIVVHSPLVRFAFDHFFPFQTGKIYAKDVSVADLIYREAKEFATLRKPMDGRDIDVIFVASSWNRPEKAYPLARKIATRCRGLRVHFVGQTNRPCAAACHHGILPRREDLYGLLGRARTLVCPSLLDSAPGVMFEASAMGCNVIASPNCGNWQLCNEQLVAARCSADEFVAKIERSLAAAYEGNRRRFRGGYPDLVETLTAF
jgi:glycosyltransferase involved in cell wall biosynthesis